VTIARVLDEDGLGVLDEGGLSIYPEA